MKSKSIKRRILIVITLIITLTDQISKYWVNSQLSINETKSLIAYIIQLRLTRNTGAAFSILTESTYLLGLLSFIVSILLITWIWKKHTFSMFNGLAIAFLLGGSLGNGIDRWRLGYVTDFLELIPFRFPIFNLADIAINIALIFFILDNLKGYHERN